MEKVTAEVAKLAVDESSADRKLLIAVDFGTTYSGVAWAQTRRVCTQRDYPRFSFLFANINCSQMFKPSLSNGPTVGLEGSKA